MPIWRAVSRTQSNSTIGSSAVAARDAIGSAGGIGGGRQSSGRRSSGTPLDALGGRVMAAIAGGGARSASTAGQSANSAVPREGLRQRSRAFVSGSVPSTAVRCNRFFARVHPT